MPPLIAAAIVGVAETIGITGLVATSAGVTAAAYGITALATIGAQFAFNRLTAKKPKKGDLQLNSFTIRQPIPPRTRAYGTVKLAGALFYEDATPVVYESLYLGVIFCEGPISAFKGFWLNDSNTGISGDNGVNLSLPWAQYIQIEGKEGTDTQTVSALLAAHRGFSTQRYFGLCYAVMQCTQPFRPDKYFQFYFPNGVPTLRALIDSSLIYDPRDGTQSWTTPSTWKFSRNPALIAMDYLTRTKTDASGRKMARGMGLPTSRINVASFTAFANLCDETVNSAYSINPFDGSVIHTPRTEPRYECSGSYTLDESPPDVLNRILGTCDATLLTLADGTIGIQGGRFSLPTVVIADEMIISADLSQGGGKFERFNHLKISFTATNLDYQVVEGSPLENTADEDDNGVMTEELHLPYVQSYSQAKRLARIAMAKGNPQWHYNSLVCNFAALDALGEEFVHVVHSLPGIDDDFIVLGFKIMLENRTVELQLASIDATAYDWNPATDDAPPPSPQGGTG